MQTPRAPHPVQRVTTVELTSVPILSQLSDEQKSGLLSAFSERKYKQGEFIFRIGDSVQGLYILKEGKCRIYAGKDGKSGVISTLLPGDYFGETGLLHDVKRKDGARVFGGPAVIYFLPKRMFQKKVNDGTLNLRFAKRRVAVSAEQQVAAANKRVDSKSKANTIKTEAQRRMIRNAMDDCVLFDALPESHLTQIVDAFYIQTVEPKTYVIREGDNGLAYYIIETGTFDVTVTGDDGKERKVRTFATPGQYFGTLALLYNQPRTASIISTSTATVWVLDRFRLQSIKANIGRKQLASRIAFLDSVTLLAPLSVAERMLVAEALHEEKYEDGDVIIKQGDEGEKMFILVQGSLDVTKMTDGDNKKLGTMSSGKCFGEIALIQQCTRTASVTAVGSALCLTIGRHAMQLLFGPLEDILQENASKYSDVKILKKRKLKARERKLQQKTPIQAQKPTIKLVPIADSISDFKDAGTLGKGAYGVVKLVYHPETKTYYALKSVDTKAVSGRRHSGHLISEKAVMVEFGAHPFLVTLHQTFRTKNHVHFLTEALLGGDLFDMLRRKGPFIGQTARFYAACLVLALQYLHKKGIVYRDLKPENVLLNRTGYIKLTDFGLAKTLKDGTGMRTYTVCGTPEYMAPEIVCGQGYGVGVDWWSFGILIFEMMAGHTPFASRDDMTLYGKILKGQVKYPSNFSSSSKKVIGEFLQRNPTQRLGVIHTDIRKHPWFSGYSWDTMEARDYIPPHAPPAFHLSDLPPGVRFSTSTPSPVSSTDPAWFDEF